MKVELALRFRIWMLLLLPLTLGVGTVAMWVWAQRLPRWVDNNGIQFRNGRFLRWAEVKRLGVIEQSFSDETARIDLYFKDGTSRIPLTFLADGTYVGDAIRSHFRSAKKPA